LFTGERVIPGEVEPDLWNEHLSRYHFAALFAAGKSVLDAGCGTGYGTALLAEQAAEAAGFDIAPDVISYATAHYPAARFLPGSTNAFPASDHSVDLVTAFDVIEHLADWEALIEEAHRVLMQEGVFLVSAPNKLYYSETRAEVEPDPFHIHEFELQGFEDALARVFPFVRILVQNRQECILFSAEQAAASGLSFTADTPDLSNAQFFVAVCAKQPVEIPSFTYVPSAANQFRERERYIRSLTAELQQARLQHATLLEAHRRLQDELDRQNSWVTSLDREVDSTRSDLSLTRVERTLARAERDRLKQERNLINSSRWLRLGRKFNLGPDLTNSSS
jgi:SAM-dependent methyltransferase